MEKSQHKQRVIIVDDEPLAIKSLRLILDKFEDFDVVAECANGYQAVESVYKLKPELMFLDIQMPGLSGFDVLEVLGKEAPATIFVTAYDAYAIKAFEAHAIDYLLKPVKQERVREALSHAQSFKPLNPDTFRTQQIPIQRILVRSGNQVNVVPVDSIIFIEAQDDFVNIRTKNESFLKYDRLGHLENLLDKKAFVRVHRSYIIHLKYLLKIESSGTDSRLAHLVNGATVPVSRSGFKRFRDLQQSE
jgi:two-component system LytT family response regulator